MIFTKLNVINYKKFKTLNIELNEDLNIFVGNNESGKSTILEIINIITTNKINSKPLPFNLTKDLFNKEVVDKYLSEIINTESTPLPEIELELYSKDDGTNSEYKGKNNKLSIDCPGIKISIKFDHDKFYNEYTKMVKEKRINDLPIEFYRVEWLDFSGSAISNYNNLCSVSFIDTSKNSYSNLIDNYINTEINNILSKDEMLSLGMAYRQNRSKFSQESLLKKLNEEITQKALLNDHTLSLSLSETIMNEWKRELSLDIDNVSFSLSGKGMQNIVKTNLALNALKEKVNIILFEEPENHLSFSNMSKLVNNLTKFNEGKQIFITTHNNFIANKIGLDKIIIINQDKSLSFRNLSNETTKYFKKLPGYNTLRIILSDNPILVEGPSDELIIQRAYFDFNNKLPIEDGIDVISVGLSFKRFCEIAEKINKKIRILTDNDGDIETNIKNKYRDYINNPNIKIYYEKDEILYTLEPSLVEANNNQLDTLRNILEFESSISKEELIYKMKSAKTESAFKIFESDKVISYPKYIEECIRNV